MPSWRFRALAQILLDEGISPKYVVRLDQELHEHLTDLRASASLEHRLPEEAKAEALVRLGDTEVIAAAFLERPELKLWIYRWPWVVLANVLARFVLSMFRPFLVLAQHRVLIARYSAAAVLSVGATVGLLLFMQALIATDLSELGLDTDRRTAQFRVTRIILEEEYEIETRDEAETADPPDELYERRLRPEGTELLAKAGDWSDESIVLDGDWGSQPTASVTLEPFGLGIDDGDYLPVVKVAPAYPTLALARGLEGYVVVEFTITRTGAVKDVLVVESSSRLFERGSIEAVHKFKYRPRIVAGEPIEVLRVRNRITFELEA